MVRKCGELWRNCEEKGAWVDAHTVKFGPLGVSNGVPNHPFSILYMGGTSPRASALASAPHEIQGQKYNYKAFRDIFRAGVPRLQPPEARKGNFARKSRSAAQWLEGKSRDRGKRKSKSALRSGEKRGNVDLELDSLRSAEYYFACFARGVSRRRPLGSAKQEASTPREGSWVGASTGRRI